MDGKKGIMCPFSSLGKQNALPKLEPPKSSKSYSVGDLDVHRGPSIDEFWSRNLGDAVLPTVVSWSGIPTLVLGFFLMIIAAKGLSRKSDRGGSP
jgi:hypothetical protein